MTSPLDARPIVVAIAGPNGAGKSTFYATYLADTGLRFVNADDLAFTLGLDARAGSALADALRNELVEQGESFVFETVFSDPVGAKVSFLERAVERGYGVVLCFIGLADARHSDERVAMRVLQGGHDVPPAKILERYPRSLANLRRAIAVLPHVWVYDNTDLAAPYRKVAEFVSGELQSGFDAIPDWLERVLRG